MDTVVGVAVVVEGVGDGVGARVVGVGADVGDAVGNGVSVGSGSDSVVGAGVAGVAQTPGLQIDFSLQ